MEKFENKNYDLESLDVESVTNESKRKLNELEDDVVEQMNGNLDTPEEALEAILDAMNGNTEVYYGRKIDLKRVKSRDNRVTYNDLGGGSYEFVVHYQIDDGIANGISLLENNVTYYLEYDAKNNKFYKDDDELSDEDALDELTNIYSFVRAINGKKASKGKGRNSNRR